MAKSFDCVVIGAGVLGLAHAYHLARRGKKVAVLERHPQAVGASIRNFGMLWPIGQPGGDLTDLAMRSVDIWKEVLDEAGIWYNPYGSLHLAYEEDEAQVLKEFCGLPEARGRRLELLDPSQLTRRFSSVRAEGLKLGLFSPSEVCVDPRETIARLPEYLHKKYHVQFFWNTPVQAIDSPKIHTNHCEFHADKILLCTGSDYQQLYPEAFASEGIRQCKLQMLRTPPLPNFKLGAHLAAGLTLRHYKAFTKCPTLKELIARFDRDLPEYHHYGIHVMASQNGLGELVLGDSHEYGDSIEPFNKELIDELIIKYLKKFLNLDPIIIASRWHGVYAKHPTEAYLIRNPAPGVTAVNMVGGAGMTLSFGLAERAVKALLGESYAD
ncbi:TIGR03364 family FAD-dependent oxidoreductase [Telmatocola sphagniphila]|uniref:TIGR03364 family FAD-dependent oxidoreductase n=1 Tax=Telmatocola sphagniphila TaxID=1123043 RepID=A0A8E6ES32_9BACT|nr:TIGR03364 family FAD-dependent oxidoreductase [Telmatocola sphagniphila]QVL30079.1 TIGR03364 family FAD-dependent oxidoreductase [Telmatocola sphagniphila]